MICHLTTVWFSNEDGDGVWKKTCTFWKVSLLMTSKTLVFSFLDICPSQALLKHCQENGWFQDVCPLDQAYCKQIFWGSNHLLSIVFRSHYHSQDLIQFYLPPKPVTPSPPSLLLTCLESRIPKTKKTEFAYLLISWFSGRIQPTQVFGGTPRVTTPRTWRKKFSDVVKLMEIYENLGDSLHFNY